MTPEFKQFLITTAASILTGIITRWLSRRYPKVWAEIQTALPPETLDTLVTSVGTSKGREGLVRQLVSEYAHQHGVELTETQLDVVINELGRCWKAGVRFASSAVKVKK